MKKKIIFGLVGEFSSGKGAAAKYLEEKYQAATFRFSTPLRHILDRLYLEQTRDNLIKLSEKLREAFGEKILAETIGRDAQKAVQPLIVIEGIRRLADLSSLDDWPNFVLVEIFAEPQIRYQRLVQRNENSDDTSKTYEQFLADQQRSTEISIQEVIKKAKERINNNGSEDELRRQLDKLVEKYVNLC